jgi:MFS family permease
VITSPFPVLIIRFSEGIGAGCFVASAMSYVNTLADHERMSGYFMAMLNAGLVAGLITAGWLGGFFQQPALGIMFFSCCAIIPVVTGFFISESPVTAQKRGNFVLLPLVKEYRYLWYSSVILVGITGVVISLYPEFSGVSSHTVGIWIALMSVSTIIAVLIASRTSLPPVQTIRLCAVMMVFGVLISYYMTFGIFNFSGNLN